jgi:NAD+-dependent protein deacetylase sirtuin 6
VRTDSVTVSKEAMRPSYSHEALQKLASLGIIHHIISLNIDGLHRLSGVPRDRLSEMHGNMFHERCEKCGTRYERPYAVSRRVGCISNPVPRICIHCHVNHRTGRICERKV